MTATTVRDAHNPEYESRELARVFRNELLAEGIDPSKVAVTHMFFDTGTGVVELETKARADLE